MWFTSDGGVGRITPTGRVTLFTAGVSSGAQPISITTGPDGNLWFTEPNVGRIGRITSDGVVTEFPVGSPRNGDDDIVAGPDGNLWFTDTVGNSIGRITTQGEVTMFAGGIPPGANLLSIALGPDGNLWFTASQADAIGRVTSGAVRTLTVTTAGSGSGTVSSSPAGMSCGATCSQSVDYLSTVTLTASPGQGSEFAGWSGGGCTGAVPACTVTMSEARAVTATFGAVRLSATLLPSRPSVVNGQRLRVGIRAANRSGVTAPSVTSCIRLPRHLAVVAAPGARRSGRTVCFALGNLPPGARATRTVVATARAARRVTVSVAGSARARGGQRADARPVRVVVRAAGAPAVVG